MCSQPERRSTPSASGWARRPSRGAGNADAGGDSITGAPRLFTGHSDRDRRGTEIWSGTYSVASLVRSFRDGQRSNSADSGMRRCRRRAVDLEEERVPIAPPPVLARLVGADERVVLLVPVSGGVLVGRVVAAPDVPAR